MAAPKLLLVDEMSLGLAPIVAEQLIDILKSIRDTGVIVLELPQSHSRITPSRGRM